MDSYLSFIKRLPIAFALLAIAALSLIAASLPTGEREKAIMADVMQEALAEIGKE